MPADHPTADHPTAEPEARLLRLAAGHHGLFRMSDAARLGLTPRQVQRRVRAGRFERVGKGVYRVGGSDHSPVQALLAATWRTAGPASQLSATWVHGLSRTAPDPPEVTVGGRRAHEFDGIRVFRSDDLAPHHVVRRGPLVVTTPARTLADIGTRVTRERLEGLVHEAVHRRLTTFAELVTMHGAISRRGRNGSAGLGEILSQLVPGQVEPLESRLETSVLRAIRDHGLPEPVAQHVVVVAGQAFRLDMSYPVVGLFIEGDGFGVHGGRSAFENDRRRQNLLVAAGWTPLRFTWRQVRADPRSVGTLVEATLRRLGHPDLAA